jgi:hypothetical protein
MRRRNPVRADQHLCERFSSFSDCNSMLALGCYASLMTTEREERKFYVTRLGGRCGVHHMTESEAIEWLKETAGLNQVSKALLGIARKPCVWLSLLSMLSMATPMISPRELMEFASSR